ncbi:MAG: winged helix-turn-helix transcriptional regulator [Gemmatimonadales bacterium]|nr:winged helix-turn-helix transcriptional regulator [Gemmatimonadales bacterium]
MVVKRKSRQSGVQFTEDTADLVAERFRALAEPMRLRLLNALRPRARSVGELVGLTGTSQANVSKHLQLLYKQGFVDREKDGTTIYYRIADPMVFEMCDLVCDGIQQDLDARRARLNPER